MVPPCREEQAALMALAHRRASPSMASPTRTSARDSRRFLADFGNPYDRVAVDRDGTTAINFGVYGVPETYVVDPHRPHPLPPGRPAERV